MVALGTEDAFPLLMAASSANISIGAFSLATDAGFAGLEIATGFDGSVGTRFVECASALLDPAIRTYF